MTPDGVWCGEINRNICGLSGICDGQWHRSGGTELLIGVMDQFVIWSPDTSAGVAHAPGLGKGCASGNISIIRDGHIGDKRGAVGAIGRVGGLKCANRWSDS